MTTTTERPRTIRAEIDQQAISRVPSFFDASLTDIMNELLQNSRRAGATNVRITAGNGSIAVADNGRAIIDPQTLLSFGRSDWTDDRVRDEHPAGMGTYALARRQSVRITSRPADAEHWEVRLQPEHFCGEAEAEVRTLRPEEGPTGTTVAFDWNEEWKTDIEAAARFCPLDVTLNGQHVARLDFLEDADAVVVWNGLRIGVYRRSNTGWADRRRINFHGVSVWASKHLPAVSLVGNYSARVAAAVDVIDCPGLELTLPARKDIVATPFIAELHEACKRAIYSFLAGWTQCPGVPRATQQEAARMGIQIADPAAVLETWQPQTEWESSDMPQPGQPGQAPGDGILVCADLDRSEQHNLYEAARRGHIEQRLFVAEDAGLQGYAWYDQLSRLTQMATKATFGKEQYRIRTTTTRCPHSGPTGLTSTCWYGGPTGRPGRSRWKPT